MDLVRAHLDYAVQFWRPFHMPDVDIFGTIHTRMTKMIQVLRNIPYKDRFKRFNLHSLGKRRLCGN